ncbi:MAG: zinc ABC transporter substrate-binding protein [Steroidobacteraceae bacterium]
MRIKATLLASVLALSTLLAVPAPAAEPTGLVLTGLQATYSVTVALTAGTSIQVQNVPADGRAFGQLKDYLSRRRDALAPQYASATAVVAVTNALPDDPLFRFARDANVRIVAIDAAVPWSLDRPGVALVDIPRSTLKGGADTDVAAGTTAPYFWLSLANVIRMADIVADDLVALFPPSADAIRRNLDGLKRDLLRQRSAYQARLAESSGDVVFALTPDFVYLTNDAGLLVDGYFIKQDVSWTKADLAALTRRLKEGHIKAVLHRWQPSEEIQAAIRAGGAKLVVLDPADPGLVVDDKLDPEGLQKILKRDLDAVFTALD